MKEKKIVRVDCHLGVYQFGSQKALSKEKIEGIEFEMNAAGVFCKARGIQIFVPFSNITHIQLEDSVEASPDKVKKIK